MTFLPDPSDWKRGKTAYLKADVKRAAPGYPQ